ncbi:MAG: hypothetical protein GQ533_07435 [Methanosarcinaceae archaeon]|nr:hypothetical protein [Methanosarcinaceae archaeon]
MEKTMKPREDYLIEFEVKLLGILKELYKSVNHNITITYVLSMFVVLFQWGSVTEISFLGAKLALNKTNILIFIPILISIIYILIDFQLIRVKEVYSEIHMNANELLSINSEAKPITMKEIHLFGAGVTGLILSLSRWQANRLLTDTPFKYHPNLFSKEESLIRFWENISEFKIFLNNVIERLFWIRNVFIWFITTTIRFIITVSLFLLPIIVVAYYNYMEFFYHKNIIVGTPILSLGMSLLVAFFTIVCGSVLFVTYFVDLIESFKKDFAESAKELLEFFDKIAENKFFKMISESEIFRGLMSIIVSTI